MNASTAGNGNPSALQEKENVKGRGKTLAATGPNEKRNKGLCLLCDEKSTPGRKCSSKKLVSLIEDESEDVVDVPTVDPVIIEEKEVDMAISLDAVVEYSHPYEGGSCVTGYHGKRPLTVLMGAGGTSHNFINESLADKLGCDTVPIKPRTVRSAIWKMVTSRACNNFQLSLQGTKFSLKMYLLPLSSNCDIVLGSEWIASLTNLYLVLKAWNSTFKVKSKLRLSKNQLEAASSE